MNIAKYGISNCVGYGFFAYGSSGSRDYFYTNKTIVARSASTTDSKRPLKWTPTNMYGLQIGNSNYNPVYVVFDGDSGTWKEYFSGMTVGVVNGSSSYGDFDVDKMSGYIDVLSISSPRECNAVQFAEGVSKYTDKQAKEIMEQLRSLSEGAKKWKAEIESLIKDVKDERVQKEAGLSSVESKLASGFGKYGNSSSNSGQQSSGAQQTSKTQQDSHPKQPPTQEEKLQWIRHGRCAYCGGEFKGLFSKVCRECGKAKNYR